MKNGMTIVGLTMLSLSLSGCSTGDPDDGTGNNITTSTLVGLGVDGYVAGGLVYYDTNENFLLDSWEPRAFTDSDGYFSQSKMRDDGTRINYCAASATVAQQKFCLEVTGTSDNALIRLVGGYDIFSGEPFKGSMSLRTTIPFPEGSPPVISPLTTLLAQIDTDLTAQAYADRRTRLLALFGLNNDDTLLDFLADPNAAGGINSQAYQAALQLQKSVEVISNKFAEHYPMVGTEPDIPVDVSEIVFAALEQQLSTITDLTQTDAAFFRTVLTTAEAALRELIARVNQARDDADDELLTLPSELSVSDPGNRIGQLAAQVSPFVAALFEDLIEETNTSEQNVGQARALQRALEVVVRKISDEDHTAAPDPSIQSAMDLATGDNGVTADDQSNYLAVLESSDNDISGLFDNDFSDPAEIVTEATVTDLDIFNPQSELVQLPLAGSKMRLAGQEQSDGKTSLVDAIFYFSGASSALSGDLILCATYQESIAQSDDDDIDREFFQGTWELLNGVNDSTVLLKASLAGGEFSLVVKSVGMRDGEPSYRFNFQGNLRGFSAISSNVDNPNTARVALSQNVIGSIEDGGVVPSNSAQCASAMTSPAFPAQ